MTPLSVEQMVRNLLDAAIAEGPVVFNQKNYTVTECPQELTAGDLVGTANLLAKYLRLGHPGDAVLVPSLFQSGNFTLASGAKSTFRIDCEVLVSRDWVTLAHLAVERLPAFGKVVGVPMGGLAFAIALEAHATEGHETLLIAEDVVTTGESMEGLRAKVNWKGPIVGVCAFARGPVPPWVTPLFTLTPVPVPAPAKAGDGPDEDVVTLAKRTLDMSILKDEGMTRKLAREIIRLDNLRKGKA